jgi:hypothetical protein
MFVVGDRVQMSQAGRNCYPNESSKICPNPWFTEGEVVNIEDHLDFGWDDEPDEDNLSIRVKWFIDDDKKGVYQNVYGERHLEHSGPPPKIEDCF